MEGDGFASGTKGLFSLKKCGVDRGVISESRLFEDAALQKFDSSATLILLDYTPCFCRKIGVSLLLVLTILLF